MILSEGVFALLREKCKLKNVHEAGERTQHYLMEKHPMNFINRIIDYERAFHSVSCGNGKFDYRKLIHVAFDWLLCTMKLSSK